MATKTKEVTLQALTPVTMTLDLEGTSEYLSHKFAESNMEKIEKKQKKQATVRELRDYDVELEESMHVVVGNEKKKPTDGKYGIPAISFKNSAVAAISQGITGLTKVQARGAFFVYSETGGDIIPAKCKKFVMDKRTVNVGGFGKGSRDIRIRGKFQDWSCTLRIEFNKNVVSPEQIIKLFDIAGFSVGVGDYRPQMNGMYGRFRVAVKQK